MDENVDRPKNLPADSSAVSAADLPTPVTDILELAHDMKM
jgi:hypothetical protein